MSEKSAKKNGIIILISALVACAVTALIVLLFTVIMPDAKYNAAVALFDEGKYEEALIAFEALDGYRDSATQIENCNTGILNEKYDVAVALYNEGKYTEAISTFKALDGYKDSESKIEECYIGKYGEEKWDIIKNIKAGDTFIFGSYEQDNNTSNGKEGIEWLVLAKEDNKILVISDKALDFQPYNTKYTSVTWEICTLRTWLNNTFFNAAFSAEEQSQILKTIVSADKNPSYSTNPGNSTTDKVFLISITETEKYFSSSEDKKCVPTAYAKAQGAYISDSETKGGEATCWWWLRSPGDDQHYVANVYDDGAVDYRGNSAGFNFCIRPALWINLES